MSSWSEYRPTSTEPWDARRVVHLHRRAVFGACRSEIERDLADGPAKSIERILTGTVRADGTLKDFDQRAAMIGDSAIDSGSLDRMRAWWVLRMLFSPDPLSERIALMWHNHFATSNAKVKDLQLMRGQNETLRKLGLGPFGELLKTMVHDPALLIWLDAPLNRAGKPNENLARELMELFTLGIGNYQETDVREAARALTGYSVRQGKFYFDAEHHDAGEKQILGQKGNWNSDDLVRILLEHKATPERLAWRLVNEFFGEGLVDAAATKELAQGLREHNLDIRWGVETILRSQLFYCDANIHTRISDPIAFLLMPLRALEYWRVPISTLVLAEWVTRFGQELFAPPNVGGWNGGKAWLSTRTIIARANYIDAIVNGRLTIPTTNLSLNLQFAMRPDTQDPIEIVRNLSSLIFGANDFPWSTEVAKHLPESTDFETQLKVALKSIMNLPQGHLH